MRYYQIMSESATRVTVWSGATITVLHNPSMAIFQNFAKKHRAIRGLITPDGTSLYLWDGSMAVHPNMMQELGLQRVDCVAYVDGKWKGDVFTDGYNYKPTIERITPRKHDPAEDDALLKALGEATKPAPPKPEPKHLMDAIDHANWMQKPWTLKDFQLKYEGYLTVDEIGEFDDTYGWLEAHKPNDLEDFRSGGFSGEPREMPPIVVITAPNDEGCHTQVGDGRGRVNFANAHNMRLHVWHLIHKRCLTNL